MQLCYQRDGSFKPSRNSQ